MTTAPLFSIATPTRNALGNLRRCVGSVRGQHEVPREHLVQDGASNDGSAAWLADQPDLDSISEPDEGMYDAIGRAWSRSSGRYLSWLNADEQYLPGTLSRIHRLFEQHPDADVLFGDYLVADAGGRAVALRREIPLRRFYVVNSFLNAQSCTLFFRRGLFERGLLRFDPRYRYAADKDLVLRLLCAGVRFRHVPEVLSVFGINGENLSTHDRMHTEAEAIRLAHGGFHWRPLRGLALGGRRIERLLRGAYRSSEVHYRFALDEVPNYAHYSARGTGGRYSLADVTGRAELSTPIGGLRAAPRPEDSA